MTVLRHANQLTGTHTVLYVFYDEDREDFLELEAEAQLTVAVHPGEPMVMYDRNGEGYPGSPATFEVLDVELGAVSLHDVSGREVLHVMSAAERADLVRRIRCETERESRRGRIWDAIAEYVNPGDDYDDERRWL